jgi:hypothetical protein
MMNAGDPDAETRILIEGSVSEMFGRTEPGRFYRLGELLDQLGWDDVASEYPLVAQQILATAHAVSLTTSDLLDRTLLEQLASALPTPPADERTLVLLPTPPAAVPSSRPGHATGLLTTHPQPDDTIVVPLLGDDGIRITTVAGADVETVALRTFDPTVSWRGATAALTDDGHRADDEWRRALAAGHRVIATQVLALATRAVEITADHVSSRRQYGHTIAAFQAVRHRLAQARAEVDGAATLLDIAWEISDYAHARAARIAVSDAARTAISAALQLCGAIGLTEEHRLHRYTSRAMQLDVLLGTAHQLQHELADDLFGPATRGQPLPALVLAH